EALCLDEPPTLVPHYNVPPSHPVAVLRRSNGSTGRKIELLRWGLVPKWANDARIGHKLGLARSESVTTTPAFREAIRRRRCLVVVDGFFEWQRQGRTKSQPFFVRRADRAPFALAGVWERWVGHDGEVVDSCAIITQSARPPVAAIHDRMPLVLERDVWERWLDPELTETRAFAPLLEPREPALIAYPVSPLVNDPRHDDPRCIEPAAPAQLSLLTGG
ncbi:MAG TPA: SOS response-associated peptidase, partial [Polyangiaceae bacterium]|nr:SOS response-associated peptidase [Polyangiaceae bacterium]